jgi:outer membrane receptor protein involved in Fe transport
VCERSQFIGEKDECFDSSISALVDLRLANAAILSTSGVDISLERVVDSRVGRFEASLNATYTFDFSKARHYSAPLMNVLNTAGNPLRIRGTAGMLYQRGNISISSSAHHTGAYLDTISMPHRNISSWTTFDVGAGYRLGNVTIGLNAQNLFDAAPPFFNNPLGIGYDPENAELLGRFLSLGLRQEW